MDTLLVEEVQQIMVIFVFNCFFFMLLYCSFMMLGCFVCFDELVVNGDLFDSFFQ